ncbi:MAG TPA: hypothetical protein VNN62_06660 [Methylomirabilota bacterium]|nr:hypothetical protein [Methylomirabilota bacterium]
MSEKAIFSMSMTATTVVAMARQHDQVGDTNDAPSDPPPKALQSMMMNAGGENRATPLDCVARRRTVVRVHQATFLAM